LRLLFGVDTRAWIAVALAAAGCSSSSNGGGADPPPGNHGPAPGGGVVGVNGGGGGPPIKSGAFTVLGSGLDFRDASSDQAGNVWGVTDGKVWFFAGGSAWSYDASSGLARGRTTWDDAYWCLGSTPCPTTNPVRFSAVAGGMAGEAFVGNIGFLGDRLRVDPSTGAVLAVVGLAVGELQQPKPDERLAQQQREVATWRAVVDLNGTLGGTAYFGGFHGTSALHGMGEARASGSCGCVDFEEHVHPFSVSGNDVFGGDVHAAFVTATGDVWLGDRLAVYLLPQRSLGASTDLFVGFAPLDATGRQYLDVFPGVDDWCSGIAADAKGGVYVASNANGMAYLAPGGYAPTYFTAGADLPSNKLTGLDIDGSGDVWIATSGDGAVRYSPATGVFRRITTADGLPSNVVRQVQVDKHGAPPRAVYFATASGVAVYPLP
jgi:hypothetical protein